MKKLLFRFASLAQGKPLFWEVRESSGQALLIILLTMAVALTIGLSVVSRSITDIKISQQTEEAARAFSAAEAGIEEALVGTGELFQGTFEETEAKFEAKRVNFGEGTEFVFPQEIQVDDPQTVYLAKYETDGTLTPYYNKSSIDLCWNGNAAIEASLYYESGGYKVARYATDPNGASRTPPNNFDPPDAGSCAGLAHRKTLSFPTGTPLFLRLRVLYANAKVGVETPGGAGGVLPSQGNKIESTGQAGASTRKVEVVRFYPAPLAIFDFGLYSERDLSK